MRASSLFLFAIGFGFFGLPAYGAGPVAPVPTSGQYGSLTLVIAGDTVTGTFFDARGELSSSGAPAFTCIFLLRGRLDGARAAITTWIPGDRSSIQGELVFGDDEVSLTLMDDQPGCATTGDEMTQAPLTEVLSTRGKDWIGVSMVSAGRAVLRPMPAATSRRTPYLVQFDPVVILQRQQAWVRVTYLGGDTPVTGWLRQADLASQDPPHLQ